MHHLFNRYYLAMFNSIVEDEDYTYIPPTKTKVHDERFNEPYIRKGE